MRFVLTIAAVVVLTATLARGQVVPTDEDIMLPTTEEPTISLPTPPPNPVTTEEPTISLPTPPPNPVTTEEPTISLPTPPPNPITTTDVIISISIIEGNETTMPVITDPAGSTIDNNTIVSDPSVAPTTIDQTDKPCLGWCHTPNAAPGVGQLVGATFGVIFTTLCVMAM